MCNLSSYMFGQGKGFVPILRAWSFPGFRVYTNKSLKYIDFLLIAKMIGIV